MSSINIGQNFNKCIDSLKDGYNNKVKPVLTDGIQYSSDLKNDVVEFAKKNPKKTGAIAAAALFCSSLIGIGVKIVKDNIKMRQISAIKSEHIEHQREIIDGLKDDITDRQYIIDTQHEALDALHNSFNSFRDRVNCQTGE